MLRSFKLACKTCKPVAVGIALLAVGVWSSANETLAADVKLRSQDVPGKHWQKLDHLEKSGWSVETLQSAQRYSRGISTEAVVIVQNGRIVAEWGAPKTKFNVHSIRKSFISALYGIAVEQGQVDLEKTLSQLGIDDEPALTTEEKSARVIDLLKARSGVYHAALYESPDMIARKPKRGTHPARTFWSYNNWDFNALGTIYEKCTKTSIFKSFQEEIARPIGMESFLLSDTEYVRGNDSIHPAYPFRMTAEDMARFGLLYLRNGNWNGRQIIPKAWVRASTTAYSIAEGDAEYGYSGYGYLWWVAVNGNHFPDVEIQDGSFSARGWGGHFILVIPDRDLVIVHRVNTDVPGREVTTAEFGHLVRLILAAQQTPRRGQGNHIEN
jgi:CubicO group peptidase (beta-lactamase class C family)